MSNNSSGNNNSNNNNNGSTDTEVRILCSSNPKSTWDASDDTIEWDDVNVEDEDLIEGLSLYDLSREPLDVIPDETITVPIRAITQEMTCPICLSMITKTVTVMECLHRFCHQCLNISISQANKRQCPSCRAKLASLRNTRNDENFDSFIRCLFPDRDAYEDHMDALITKIASEATQSSRLLMQKVEEGLKRQSLAKKKRFRTSATSVPTTNQKKVKYNTPNHASLYQNGKINFKLELHLKAATLQAQLMRPWVTTKSEATIGSLFKVLSNIYFQTTDRANEFRIGVKLKEDEEPKELQGELTLAEAYERNWLTTDKKFVLYFWDTTTAST